MADDIRVAVGFPDHPKTVKLVRKVGENAVRSLLRLWLWTRVNRPTTGTFDGMDDEDIEIASGWDGPVGQFVAALRVVGFLEGTTLHGWAERQEYAVAEQERSDRAALKAYRRWGHNDEEAKAKLEQKQQLRRGIRQLVPQHSPGSATVVQQQCSPPVPTPPDPTHPPEEPLSGKTPDTVPRDTIPYEKIVGLLNQNAGTHFKPDGAETKRLIKARWKAGFRVADFEWVIRVKSAQWTTDPTMVGYLRPSTLFGAKFEAYLNERPCSEVADGCADVAEDPALQARIQEARKKHPWLGKDHA